MTEVDADSGLTLRSMEAQANGLERGSMRAAGKWGHLSGWPQKRKLPGASEWLGACWEGGTPMQMHGQACERIPLL